MIRAIIATLALLIALPAFAYIDPREEPFTKDSLVALLEAQPEATTLDQLPALLPDSFLLNFTLKHGLLRKGERGHLVEKKVSQSSDPLAPRAVLWDERSGFTISYNGGLANQTAGQRLDMMRFDPVKKVFHLEQIDFPIQPRQPKVTTSDCRSCHGPTERPIFAMYPDWPSFYGSDNDELKDSTKLVQKLELADYQKFVKEVAPNHPRYSPLFSQERNKSLLGWNLFSTYPYRPDVSTKTKNPSRAFAFRASLRLGILLNRLNAQAVSARIFAHPNYEELAPYFLSNLLQCLPTQASSKWLKRSEMALGETPRLVGGRLHYRQLLKLFGLSVNEIDIRYSYNHEGYASDDASKNVMAVGYINQYWNSYFDGSATIDELLAYRILQDLESKIPGLRGKFRADGLVRKYAHLTERYRLDENFFREMDEKGEWLPIPYPAQLADVHHREPYKKEFASQHTAVCRALEGELTKR